MSKLYMTKCIRWTDSTVFLLWIKEENGNYKQFVCNWVTKINELDSISCKRVQTLQNPADIGCRVCFEGKLFRTWFTGPSWLTKEELWLEGHLTSFTPESKIGSKTIRTINSILKTISKTIIRTLHYHPFNSEKIWY